MIRILLLLLLFHILIQLTLAGQTVLYPGDVAVLGLASNVGGDQGNCTSGGQFQGRDRISFISFKEIATGTIIDFTDNGWERINPGLWGNTEGFIRATRTGTSIPAGTVITFEFPPTQTGHLAITPDANWEFLLLGTNALNFNDSGDQLYVMQGGMWNNGTTIGCCNGEQDATYTGGRILFGFNSRSEWNAGVDDSQNSGLHPDVTPCFSMAPTNGVTNFTSYTGPFSMATQLEWIARIGNPDNWSAFDDCEQYQDPPSEILIAASGMQLDCQICNSCSPFADTLLVQLPLTGGPFMVDYTDGTDTFLLADAENLQEIPVFIAQLTNFDLVRVTDINGCPIYSNFENGTSLEVNAEPITLNCRVLSDPPNGMVEIGINSGQSPFTLSWTDEQGLMGIEILDGMGNHVLEGLQNGGNYQLEITDAGGCVGNCSFHLAGDDCSDVNLHAIIVTRPGADCNSPSIDLEIIAINGGSAPYSLEHPLTGQLTPITEFPLLFSGISSGITSLGIQDANGCRQEVEVPFIAIEPGPSPSLSLGPDVAITVGQSTVLRGQASFDPIAVSWQPATGLSDPRSLITAASPLETTLYILTATHAYGCSVSDTILVEVSPEYSAFVPSAFSPNNDGVNDLLTIFPGPEIAEIRAFKVFDRWGNLVFDAPAGGISEVRGWDGNLQNGQSASAGVYLFFAELVDQNGQAEFLQGGVSLLR